LSHSVLVRTVKLPNNVIMWGEEVAVTRAFLLSTSVLTILLLAYM